MNESTEGLPRLPQGSEWLSITIPVNRNDMPSPREISPTLVEAYERVYREMAA